MSGYILCQVKRAKNPYYISNISTNIYSIEELCYYLYHNIYLLDETIINEQLLVYFIFTYFCGAVYDGRIYAKVQMAVISTFHIYELWKARWIKNEGELTPEEIVELVYRYSREIEHSDKNLERMEKMMLRDRLPWYRG